MSSSMEYAFVSSLSVTAGVYGQAFEQPSSNAFSRWVVRLNHRPPWPITAGVYDTRAANNRRSVLILIITQQQHVYQSVHHVIDNVIGDVTGMLSLTLMLVSVIRRSSLHAEHFLRVQVRSILYSGMVSGTTVRALVLDRFSQKIKNRIER